MTRIPFIDLKAQYSALESSIRRRMDRVLEHGQFIMGPEVRELEEMLEHYTGAKHCVTASSGTDARLISLMALGIGPGDEVITTPFTFAATTEVILRLGGVPVFVDIEPETCNMAVSGIEAAVTPKTKAILPVSLYGQPPDMSEIIEVASRCGNIPVIEDAAQSFGSTYLGKKSCNLSTVGCTSFFPSKPLGCYGDGGAIFTSRDDIAEACREIRLHGQSERYIHSRLGVGGRMDTIQCAVVLAKLESFDREVELRQEKATFYNNLLDNEGVARVQLKGNRTSVYGQYTMFSEQRGLLQDHLRRAGLPSAVHYPVPLHLQPAYRSGSVSGNLTNTVTASNCVLSLPFSAYISEDQQRSVVDALLMT